MKNFFTILEEKFVFPIGRRSWNIFVLLALLGLAGGILFFVLNLFPAGRGEVSVSKNEVIENRVDTTVVVVNTETTCSQADFNSWVDTLKSDLPKSEWKNLGDSSEPYETYLVDDYGNDIIDDYGNYLRVTKRNFEKNIYAIPNQLDDLFNNHGLDSADYCEKIELIKTLHALNKITQADFLAESAIYNYFYSLSNNRNLTKVTVDRSNELFNLIENASPFLKNETDQNQYNQYLSFMLRSSSIDEHKISMIKLLLNAHRALPNPKYTKNGYFSLAEVIIDNDLPSEELENAMKGFLDDLGFYDAKDLKGSLKRYLKIYQEKLDRELSLQAIKNAEKANNRNYSLLLAGASFIGAILIAIILTLFSIRSLLKQHVEKS